MSLWFMITELDKQVRDIFVLCVGEVDPEISTMELLKRIELRMESLTQDLERLPAEKVKIAQRVIMALLLMTSHHHYPSSHSPLFKEKS
jgi:hypothetical protein